MPQEPPSRPSLWIPSNISWHPLLPRPQLPILRTTIAPADLIFILMLINNLGADGPGAIRPAQTRPLWVRTSILSLFPKFRSSLAPRMHTFLESWLFITALLCLIIYADLHFHVAVNEIDAVVYVLQPSPFLSEFCCGAARSLNSHHSKNTSKRHNIVDRCTTHRTYYRHIASNY